MIIGKDIMPERQIYRTGALLLGVLKDIPGNDVDIFDVFAQVKQLENMSLNAFLLSLDWLFIMGAITNDNGRIIKCF